MQKRNSKYFELAVSIMIFCVSGYMIYVAQTTGLPTTDGSMTSMAFPRAIYIAIMVMCAYLIAKAIIWFKNNPKSEVTAEKGSLIPKKTVLTFIAICIYAALWEVIGFTLSTLLFVFAESYMLDRKRPIWLTAAVAIGATVIMYVVFGMMFKVSFPDPFMDMIRGF